MGLIAMVNELSTRQLANESAISLTSVQQLLKNTRLIPIRFNESKNYLKMTLNVTDNFAK